jgi:putative hydrolase
LTVANGPSPERLEKQLDVLTSLNEALAPFRILTRIACDISADHSLDRTDELRGRPEVLVRRERP